VVKVISDKDKTNKAGKTIAIEYAYRNLKAYFRFGLITLIGLAADLATKHWAVNNIPSDEYGNPQPIDIIPDYFRFILGHNPGAVWGIGAGNTKLLLITSMIAVILLLWFFALSRASQWGWHIALGMMLAGALGNLYNRLFTGGYVVDFIQIDLHFWPANPWPTFNIADILLTLGVGVLLICMLRHSRSEGRPE